jgi:hypothetical protein
MLGFVTIGVAALAGFIGLDMRAVVACAIALALLSYAEHYPLYRHGHELGFYGVLRSAVLRSFANGLVAAAGAYASGYLLRMA